MIPWYGQTPGLIVFDLMYRKGRDLSRHHCVNVVSGLRNGSRWR